MSNPSHANSGVRPPLYAGSIHPISRPGTQPGLLRRFSLFATRLVAERFDRLYRGAIFHRACRTGLGVSQHPSSRRGSPDPTPIPGMGVEVAAAVLVIGYGVVADRILPEAAYVPVNLAAAAAAILLARHAGVTMADMGMERARLARGIRTGLITVAPVAALIAIGVAIPWSRRFFLDTGVVSAGTGRVLYEMFVRIPLGTALAEEMLFRGALLGLFLRRHRPGTAVALTSVLFGLWHISPTLRSFTGNPAAASAVASGIAARVGAIAGVVAVTSLAGTVFAWLRLRSGSIAAPWIAHTSLNSLAFLGGRIASRLQ